MESNTAKNTATWTSKDGIVHLILCKKCHGRLYYLTIMGIQFVYCNRCGMSKGVVIGNS